jgi:2-C-methyl-D-erythritol 4-phosphate cytidylyltransferase
LSTPSLYALIPAAGTGSRIGGELPKQYLMLGAVTMLERAVDAVLADARIRQAVVVVSATDTYATNLDFDARVRLAPVGGSTRGASVRAGLNVLAEAAGDDDWVLVHDAARPCLAVEELTLLIDTLTDPVAGADGVGGLLAVPLSDTLKRSEGGRVTATLDRAQLWRAATPQMFRLGLLRAALDAPGVAHSATDEASAIERLGHAPRLVPGLPTNIKVTTATDLPLARAILAMQGRVR